MELSRAVNHIFGKVSYKNLAVGKHHLTFSVFLVWHEVSFIVNPVLFDGIEVIVLEHILELVGLLIV